MKDDTEISPLYTLALSKKAKDDLDRIRGAVSSRILSALLYLRSHPFSGKKLTGKFADLYSYRVWPYRIIYLIRRRILLVLVVRIGHRQNVYRKR